MQGTLWIGQAQAARICVRSLSVLQTPVSGTPKSVCNAGGGAAREVTIRGPIGQHPLTSPASPPLGGVTYRTILMAEKHLSSIVSVPLLLSPTRTGRELFHLFLNRSIPRTLRE